jgi:protease PrsW
VCSRAWHFERPLHGAVGAIAGAYIARARFGGALGAHISDCWRRQRLLLSAWLVPIALHTLYDGPLLLLRTTAGGTFSNPTEILLMAIIVPVTWFGAIIFAVVLGRRIAGHQKIWLQTTPKHWRGVWARSLIGLLLSYVALALMIAGTPIARIGGLILMGISLGSARKTPKIPE